MDKILTLSEIETQFISEWVLLGNPKTGESLEVQGGEILFHSKNRDEVYQKAVAMHPTRFAVLYTGTIPFDAAIVL